MFVIPEGNLRFLGSLHPGNLCPEASPRPPDILPTSSGFLLNMKIDKFAALLVLGLAFRTLQAQGTVPIAAPKTVSMEALTLPTAGTPITIDLTVRSGAKTPVTSLHQSDLTILDNGKPAPLTGFVSPAQNSNFKVILVLDTVNANYSSVAYQRSELDKFFAPEAGPFAHPTALAIMTDKGIEVQPGFTTNPAALKHELDEYTVALRTIRRSEGIYGADERLQLGTSSLELLARKELAEPGRKVLIFLSPGWPLLSGPQIDLTRKQEDSIFRSLVSLNTLLQQARITMYDINPFGPNENLIQSTYYKSFEKPVADINHVDLGDLSLQVLSEQSGGDVRLGQSNLAQQIHQCLDDAASAYAVTFAATSSQSDAKNPPPFQLHTLQVQANSADAKVKSRTAYYTQN